MTNNNLLQTAIELYKKCPEYLKDKTVTINDWTLFHDVSEPENLTIDYVWSSNKRPESKSFQIVLTALIADLERHLGMNIYPLFSITERNDDTGIEHSSQHLFRVGEIYHSHTGNAYKLVELGKGEV